MSFPTGWTGYITVTGTPVATETGYACVFFLTRSMFPGGSLGSGADWIDDLRASLAGATALNCEPVQIDTNNGILWAGADISDGVAMTTRIYAGNVGVGKMTLAERQAVYDAHFLFFSHMGSSPPPDATSYARSLSSTDDGPQTDGVAGSCIQYAGGSAEFSVFPSDSDLNLTSGTLACWVKTADAGSSYRGILCKQLAYGFFAVDNNIALYDWGGSGTHYSGVYINDSAWHHCVLRFQSGVTDGTTIHVDGSLALTCTMTVSSQSTALLIAAGTPAGIQLFSGKVDEVSVSDVLRSTDWISESKVQQSNARWTYGAWTAAGGGMNIPNFIRRKFQQAGVAA